MVHAGLGDMQNALDYLERAFDEGSHWMVFLQVDDRLDPLRDQPRFVNLLERMHFPA